jgi:hypothetical protein
MERKHFVPVAWLLIGMVAVLSVVYHKTLMPVVRGDIDVALFSRGIGSPMLLWLNGYLGVFLNFQFLSPVGALALPLILFGVVRWRRLERWQQAVLVFTVLAAGVIGAFGGFNYRYALTLQPVLVVAVVLAVWYSTGGRQRIALLATLALLDVGNTALSLDHRQRMWRADPTYTSPDTKEGSLAERLDTSPKDLNAFLEANGVSPTDTVLVNNLPIWYYVTDRPGIYFWAGSDQLFLADSKPFLFKDRTDDQVARYLRDSLHCRYIFSTAEYDIYHPRYQAFIGTHAELIAEDERGHTLFRLSDTFGR